MSALIPVARVEQTECDGELWTTYTFEDSDGEWFAYRFADWTPTTRDEIPVLCNRWHAAKVRAERADPNSPEWVYHHERNAR